MARPPVVGDLEERLAQIANEAAAPEDALEPALASIVEASGAAAGALCLYDMRQCLLRLTAEVGLSDEGCQRLQTVRRADPACWDMPLHGLLNRRAYLIESAAKNRYVPHLVEKKTIVSTVICLPLYAHSAPLGSIVLVAGTPRVFTQRDIQELWSPLKALAKMIEALRRKASTLIEPTPERDTPAMAVIEQTAMAVERDNLRALLAREKAAHAKLAAEMQKQAETLERLRDELDDATRRGGNRRLVAKLERTEAEREELRTSLEEATRMRREADEARAAAEARAEAVGETAATAASEEQRAEIDRLTAELESAHEREAELQQALLEKAAAQGDSEEGLAATREEMRIAIAAREQAEAALAEARDALQAANDRLEVLSGEVEAARSEVEHLRVQTGGAVEERTTLESQLDALRRSETEAKARAEQLDGELLMARSERDQSLRAQEEGQAELAALRETVATATSEADALREAAALGEAVRAQVAELESTLATERGWRERSEGEVARLEAELAEARAAAVPAPGDSEELAGLRRDYETLAAERDALVAERDGALARLADLDGVTVVSETVSIDAEGIPAPDETLIEEAIEDETVTVISVPSEQAPHVEHPTEPVIAVIDASETWKDIEIEGHHVSVISPEDDTAAIIAALDPVRVIANLSAGSLNSLGALRKAGCEARFWACVADVDQNYGVPIGVVEPVIPPLDPENVIRKLGDYATRDARIVTVGADVDALMSLRQALARKRVSVSMAWDAKQAIDLIQQITPDALVIDLDLPKRDGYRIVAEAIVGLDPLPFTVLVGGRVKSGEAFVGALRDRPTTDVQLPLRELLSTLAWSSEVPPSVDQRRKPKPTPFGSHGGTR